MQDAHTSIVVMSSIAEETCTELEREALGMKIVTNLCFVRSIEDEGQE